MSTNRLKPIASINVIPFVDVMLVLLVVFIITMPVTIHRLSLELLRGKGISSHRLNKAIEYSVYINKQGKISLSRSHQPPLTWVNISRFKQQWVAKTTKKHRINATLYADRSVSFQSVFNVMQIIQTHQQARVRLAYR